MPTKIVGRFSQNFARNEKLGLCPRYIVGTLFMPTLENRGGEDFHRRNFGGACNEKRYDQGPLNIEDDMSA